MKYPISKEKIIIPDGKKEWYGYDLSKIKKIDEIPKKHWMLLDKERNVLFHSENLKHVFIESKKYPIKDITIERKFTGLIY